jgi:hypothetical protein
MAALGVPSVCACACVSGWVDLVETWVSKKKHTTYVRAIKEVGSLLSLQQRHHLIQKKVVKVDITTMITNNL